MADDIDAKAILESSLDRLIEWAKAAESRLSLILPLSSGMLGALAVLAPAAGNWSVPGAIVAAFAAVLLVLSLLFAAFASFPRTTGPKRSLIYFGGIVTKDIDQYTAAMKELSGDDYLVDLARQCHRNAQIAERKYAWVQRSMVCLFLAALPWAVALFILYAGRQ
jgi:pycsar effector protein